MKAIIQKSIIQTIAEQTGITHSQAETAFTLTMDALREKLPASVANQLDSVLAGKEFDYKVVFNDKLQDLKEEAAEKLDIIKEEAAEKLEDLKTEAAQKLSSLKDSIKKVL